MLPTREPGGLPAVGMRYNAPVQRDPESVAVADADADAEPSRESGVAPARASRGAPLAAAAASGGMDWLGSSFDLAQGLDVKVMESKLSRETLDELFRS